MFPIKLEKQVRVSVEEGSDRISPYSALVSSCKALVACAGTAQGSESRWQMHSITIIGEAHALPTPPPWATLTLTRLSLAPSQDEQRIT